MKIFFSFFLFYLLAMLHSVEGVSCTRHLKSLYASQEIEVLKPPALKVGEGIGVFTPSTPAPYRFEKKYEHGLKELKRLGFEVIEGDLTKARAQEGYRSAPPEARANELMQLIRNPKVAAVMSTLGGSNSSSLLPYLDFDEIRASRKPLIGYSDVTSLHMGFLLKAGIATYYGPAVMPSFGEYPHALEETTDSFLAAIGAKPRSSNQLVAPKKWSNHFRNAMTEEWREVPRGFEENEGWKVLSEGQVTANVVIANLATLLSLAGTEFFPDLAGKILIIEEMEAPLSKEERNLRQLQLMGVFDSIEALIVGKPETFKNEGAAFGLDELILEIVGNRDYPIISHFDCSHTHPMLSIGQMSVLSIDARKGSPPEIRVVEEAFKE